MFILQEMGVCDGKIYVSALTIKPREAGYARYGGRLRELRMEATRGTEAGATTGCLQFKYEGSTNPGGRVNNFRTKVITLTEICTLSNGRTGATRNFITIIIFYERWRDRGVAVQKCKRKRKRCVP